MTLGERLHWTRHRLAAAGPAELLSRVGDLYRHLEVYSSRGAIKKRAARRINRSLPLPEMDGRLCSLDPEGVRPVLEEADRWLKHEARLLALEGLQLGRAIEWRRDYSSGTVAPLTYSLFLNHRDPSVVGDIKYLWELNRLQHLPVLALAGVLTGRQEYLDEIRYQLESWRRQNPFMLGPNWKSPLEAGLRLLSLAFVSFILGRSRSAQLFSGAVEELIYQQQYFIHRFHSRHSSANNHLVGEMAGLYAGAVIWPVFPESARWRSYAREILIKEMREQIEPDGVGKERAMEYQVFVAELFLAAAALGHAAGEPYPAAFWRRLAGMVEFLSALRDRSANLPLFGDGDSGQVLWLANSFSERVESLQTLLSSGKSEALRDLVLSFGQSLELEPLDLAEVSPLRSFPEGGYYILTDRPGGDEEVKLVFDAGPLGLPPVYAHGHADALSLWLSHGGNEFLVDPGTFCYGGSPRWRSYFRSTAAHNTVRVDGQDQSVQAGTFLWRQAAHCQVKTVSESPAFLEIEGSHDGYSRLPDPVTHLRKVRLFRGAGKVLVVDKLKCQGPHQVEIFFHFHPSCRLQRESENQFSAYRGDRRLLLKTQGPQVSSELVKGAESPLGGWLSPCFGLRVPTCTVVAKASINGPAEFTTEITLE
jgi:hypothetical protein